MGNERNDDNCKMENSKNLFCTKCGSQMSVDARYCTKCGKLIERNYQQRMNEKEQQYVEEENKMFCPECGKQVNENEKFCRYCGYKLQDINISVSKDLLKSKAMNAIEWIVGELLLL